MENVKKVYGNNSKSLLVFDQDSTGDFVIMISDNNNGETKSIELSLSAIHAIKEYLNEIIPF